MYSVILMAAMTTAGEAPDCHWGCHSCYGNCYGGCYGGCFGCCGGWGSCYGGCYGCYGCYGMGGSYGCHGCYGCWGCYGSCYGSYMMPMGAPAMPAVPAKPPETITPPKDKESLLPAKAKLIVELPADAKLFVDDQPIKTTNAAVRQFSTPELQPGQTFFYMVRVEVMKDGSPQSATRRVLIRAGEEVTANFTDLNAPSATVSTVRK